MRLDSNGQVGGTLNKSQSLLGREIRPGRLLQAREAGLTRHQDPPVAPHAIQPNHHGRMNRYPNFRGVRTLKTAHVREVYHLQRMQSTRHTLAQMQMSTPSVSPNTKHNRSQDRLDAKPQHKTTSCLNCYLPDSARHAKALNTQR